MGIARPYLVLAAELAVGGANAYPDARCRNDLQCFRRKDMGGIVDARSGKRGMGGDGTGS
jgi:hypothetical protein